jgi:hypothetical protein
MKATRQDKRIEKVLATAGSLFALTFSLIGCPGIQVATDSLTTGSVAVEADYGDAPDALSSDYPSGIVANFPTRFASNGARHLDVTDSAFGPFKTDGSLSVSAEIDATDPADPDGIQNIDEPLGVSDRDAFDDGLLTTYLAPGGTNDISFAVSVAPTAPEMTRYVNILVDWNQDGVWSGSDVNGAPEHIIKNMPVDVMPGTTKTFTTDDFIAGLNTNPTWLRMTLTTEPIDLGLYPDGWDGTGEFAKGETEDYLLREHVAWDLDNLIIGGGPGGPGGGGPGGGGPGGGGAGGGGAGGGGAGGGGSCDIYKSYSVTLCKGASRRFLALVDGFAPDGVSADSNSSGTAGVEVNEANVTITGNETGSTSVNVTVTNDGCTYHITVFVNVIECGPPPKIDCCTPAEIAKDPSRCKNCRVVGWTIHTNETPGGGGSTADGGITLTGSHGNTDPNLPTKTTVVTVFGNVVKIITTYYECDPCPQESFISADDQDGDKIPDAEDWFPNECYNPAYPHDLEEQLYVDSFFDVFFQVNTDHPIFDQTDFEIWNEEYFNALEELR